MTFPEDTQHPSRAPDFYVPGAWGSSQRPHRRCSSRRRGRPAREVGALLLRLLEAGSPSEFPDRCTSHFLPQTLLFPVWEHREDFLRPSVSGSGPGQPGASIPMPGPQAPGQRRVGGRGGLELLESCPFPGVAELGSPQHITKYSRKEAADHTLTTAPSTLAGRHACTDQDRPRRPLGEPESCLLSWLSSAPASLHIFVSFSHCVAPLSLKG